MSSKKKVIAIAVTSIAVTAGSFGIADAATKSTTTKTKFAQTSSTGIANPAAQGVGGRGQELSTLLSTLVAKGTITQAQADAIVAARDAARPAMGPQNGVNVPFEQKLTVIASALGTDTTTVLTRLKAGDTLATIAGTKKDVLIAALVADETKRIDAAVTAGTLTAAQATTLKADLVAHVTSEVNAPAPIGGPKGGRGHGGHGDRGGMMGGGAPTIPTPAIPSN